MMELFSAVLLALEEVYQVRSRKIEKNFFVDAGSIVSAKHLLASDSYFDEFALLTSNAISHISRGGEGESSEVRQG